MIPATLSEYDIECDWYLLMTCNFRCSYCFLPEEALGSKLERFATPAQWSDAFEATGKRWLIHITGGEPTVYPAFAEICELLTRKHVISINSNLSRPVIRTLADRVDPMRVSFINAGLHATERSKHSGFEVFARNARFLQDAGFRVIVTVVATPDLITTLDALDAQCAAAGLQLAPKVLRGTHEGKVYPRDYHPYEKLVLRDAIARARSHYKTRYQGWPRPSIDVFSDDELLDGLPHFRGRSCSAGFRFFVLAPNGDVHRCGGNVREFGNLLARSFKTMEGPKPCDRNYCVYFCKKYTADAARFAEVQLH